MAYYGNRFVQLNSTNSVAPVVVSNQQPSVISQPLYQVAQPYIVQTSALGYAQNSYKPDSARNESVKNDNEVFDNDEEFIVPNTPDFERSHKKLVGFHNYYDKATEIQSLQCCTCCIGCWRNCCSCCSGCENFISCPIYCWLFFIMPVFIILIIGGIVSALYGAKIIT